MFTIQIIKKKKYNATTKRKNTHHRKTRNKTQKTLFHTEHPKNNKIAKKRFIITEHIPKNKKRNFFACKSKRTHQEENDNARTKKSGHENSIAN